MEFTKLTNEYIKNKLDKNVEIIDGTLYNILNNFLLNMKVSYKIINNNNILNIELNVYIVEYNICNRCVLDSSREILNCLRCKTIYINIKDLVDVNLIKSDEYYNGYNIDYLSQIILKLANKSLYYVNLVKKCKRCNTYICNEKIICGDCYWQKVFNETYGRLLENICSICHENIYLSDAVTICGNNKHSVHKICNKNLDKCPCCRSDSILIDGINENYTNVFENILYIPINNNNNNNSELNITNYDQFNNNLILQVIEENNEDDEDNENNDIDF